MTEPTPSDEVPSSPNDPLASLQEELKECQEKYLRMLAEAENTRKRMQKERQETTQYAIENILTEFLHPIDSFEKALQFAESMSPDVKNWATGFEMLLGQFKHVLTQHGVQEYHSVGKPFDPHLHEAIEMVATTEYPAGTIVEEFVRGYKVGDRPIRVARVTVAKVPDEKKIESTDQGHNHG